MFDNIHETDIFLLALANPVAAEIIRAAQNAENAAAIGDEQARAFWARELKKACRKQYSQNG